MGKISDKRLIKIAAEFRKGMIGDKPSSGTCFMICAPLVSLLKMYGVDGDLVESDLGEWNHVWIRLADGRALDPTADQFNSYGFEQMPPIYLGAPAKIHPDAH